MALSTLTQLFINTEKLRHKTRNRLKLSTGDILRLIQCRSVFYENAIDKLFRMILRKQPFRKSPLKTYSIYESDKVELILSNHLCEGHAYKLLYHLVLHIRPILLDMHTWARTTQYGFL